MSKRPKDFHLSIKVIFRLILFFLLFFTFINYFSQSKAVNSQSESDAIRNISTKIFYGFYQRLPDNSRYAIENLSDIPIIKNIEDQSKNIYERVISFPQNQIQQFQKNLLDNLYQFLIKKIGTSN